MTAQEPYVPSHPGLFIVEFLPGSFTSRLVSLKVRSLKLSPMFLRKFTLPSQSFEVGDTIANLPPFTRVPHVAYSTLQCGPGPGDNVELNSDLGYREYIDNLPPQV